ncbi:MAG: patatin-like phospholipase family protein [Acidiferrobacterales bacterium]
MSNQKKITQPRIGIVLSSGGVRGVYAHTGFLLALEKLQIELQAATGCSAGAVVGGIFASGASVHRWADVLSTIKPGRFWRPSWFQLLWSLLVHKGRGYSGLSSADSAIEFCTDQLRVQSFEQCKIPFHALAINVTTGKKKIFSKGSLARSMVASAAIPVLYQPVEIDGDYYSDGGVVDLAPTDTICCKYNLDILIVHHVAQRSTSTLNDPMSSRWTLIEILNNLLFRQRPWYLSDKPVTVRRCPCGCDAFVIIIEPDLPPLDWPVTKHGSRVLQSAQEQTELFLEPYIEILKGNAEIPACRVDKLETEAQKSGCQN